MRRLSIALCVVVAAAAARAQTARAQTTHAQTGQAPSSRPSAAPDRQQMLALANEHMRAGRVQEAAALLRSAADRFESVQALLLLARLQASAADVPGALESLRKARTLAPNSEEVLSAFAQVSLRARLPVPAIVTLQGLTRICPDVAQYHYLLGVALMQIGDVVPAVESLRAADRLEPDQALTLVALGLSLNNRKLYADARTALVRGVELDPDNAEAIAALAESEEGVGDLQAAETHARRALARSSGNATANLVLGLLFMRAQRYADARDALQKVVAADPGSPKAHYQLSLACARLGDEACSQEHLEKYRQLLRETEQRVEQLRAQTGVSAREPKP